MGFRTRFISTADISSFIKKFQKTIVAKSVEECMRKATKTLNQSTEKRQHFSTYLKAFFVRHSSEYEPSLSDVSSVEECMSKATKTLNQSTEKRQHFSTCLKAFYLRHSYETSDSDGSYSDECRTKKAFKYVEKFCHFFVLWLSFVVPTDYLRRIFFVLLMHSSMS